MAESPAHRFGQVIGGLLEAVVRPQLEEFCQREGLYLDHQKKDRSVRRGRKVTWEDQYGNVHDLDFVVEQDGTDDTIGRPVAFLVLYCPYETLVAAFETESIDIRFDESTPDKTFREAAEAIENTSSQTMARIKERL